MHGTLRFLFLSPPIVWNMCENLHYESVYFRATQRARITIDRQYTERGQL